jgi:hypothetical protein
MEAVRAIPGHPPAMSASALKTTTDLQRTMEF